MPLRKQETLSMIITLTACLLAGCSVVRKTAGTQPANPAVQVQLQRHQVYDFKNVHFSNAFQAARANNVVQENDTSFMVTVAAENEPINPSPWYAFKVWAGQPQRVHVRLQYIHARHRYDAKQSRNGGQTWSDVAMDKYSAKDSIVSFGIQAGPDTLLIAAQEIISSSQAYQWMDSIGSLPFVHQQTIGKSIMGKPIVALNTTGSPGTKQIIVLSRQHPPEVTGYMAMQAFVHTVLGSTPLAQRFRKEYEIIIIPFLNPDGVDEGHWRHSAAGVDLNRDWEFFNQPETRAAKDFLVKKQQAQKATVYFGMDFHSTYNDVFYTNEDTLTNNPGFTNRWLQAFAAAIPQFKPNVKPSGNGGNVSKSWLMRAFKTDALTYEVGDDTPRPLLLQKGRVAAEVMMQLLLENK